MIMKKTIFVIMGMLFISSLCFSQDTIYLKKGEIIRSKVLEVRQTEVKYKLFDNLNGPTYLVDISDISNIVYENGTKVLFSNEKKNVELIPETPVAVNVAPAVQPNNQPEKMAPAVKPEKRLKMGFNLGVETGTWPATALSNMGSTSFLKGQGHTVKSLGFGIIFQYKLSKNFSLFLDGNMYNYNVLIGKQGTDVQTAWTVEESATHWDEPGAPQIQYVHNLPTDVYFDMVATGFRLGGKYYLSSKGIRPWVGAGFGYYAWEVNYCTKSKDKSYGKDSGNVSGLTYLAGVDFVLAPGLTLAPFLDMTSPVANYKIKGLFYPQWNIEYSSPIMSAYRIGLTLFF
jgi:hypothetical protein